MCTKKSKHILLIACSNVKGLPHGLDVFMNKKSSNTNAEMFLKSMQNHFIS